HGGEHVERGHAGHGGKRNGCPASAASASKRYRQSREIERVAGNARPEPGRAIALRQDADPGCKLARSHEPHESWTARSAQPADQARRGNGRGSEPDTEPTETAFERLGRIERRESALRPVSRRRRLRLDPRDAEGLRPTSPRALLCEVS